MWKLKKLFGRIFILQKLLFGDSMSTLITDDFEGLKIKDIKCEI